MPTYRSVCGVIPAEHVAVANAAFALIENNEIGFTVYRSSTPDPAHGPVGEHPGYGLWPPTHWAFNNEGSTDEMIALWNDLKDGLVVECLPYIAWGEDGNPTLEEATAAFAAVEYFQRNSQSVTPAEHFNAVVGVGMGVLEIWEDV